MAHSIYYYDKSGRRYEGKKRTCSQCGKEEIVRSNNKGIRCQKCVRKRPEGSVNYLDSNGKTYAGRIKICKICGKKEVKRLINQTDLCRKCVCQKRKLTIKEGELFVKRTNGERARAKILKCSCCGKKRIARGDYNYKTSLCRECNAIALGKIYGTTNGIVSRTHGMSCYRKECLKVNEEKCKCCCSLINILIHHIDANRYNNEPANLLPLCPSCHRLVHWKIRKGFNYYEAIEIVQKYKPNVKRLYI